MADSDAVKSLNYFKERIPRYCVKFRRRNPGRVSAFKDRNKQESEESLPLECAEVAKEALKDDHGTAFMEGKTLVLEGGGEDTEHANVGDSAAAQAVPT